MDRISTATAVPNLFGVGKAGFTDGDPVAGTPATNLNAAWYNGSQEEEVGLIELSGIVPSASDLTQMAAAVRSQRLNYFPAGGTANALAVTPTPAFASLAALLGVPLRIKIGTTNTAAATLNVNGLGAVPIVTSTGAALLAGDLAAGAILTVIHDGSAFQVEAFSTGFSQSLATKGYTRLPNGLLVNWGTTPVLAPGASHTETFALAFSVGCYAVLGTPVVASGTVASQSASAYAISASQALLSNTGSPSFAIYYFALGK